MQWDNLWFLHGLPHILPWHTIYQDHSILPSIVHPNYMLNTRHIGYLLPAPQGKSSITFPLSTFLSLWVRPCTVKISLVVLDGAHVRKMPGSLRLHNFNVCVQKWGVPGNEATRDEDTLYNIKLSSYVTLTSTQWTHHWSEALLFKDGIWYQSNGCIQ